MVDVRAEAGEGVLLLRCFINAAVAAAVRAVVILVASPHHPTVRKDKVRRGGPAYTRSDSSFTAIFDILAVERHRRTEPRRVQHRYRRE